MPATLSKFGAVPLVSVVMANFEAGDKIVAALRSVLRQTMADLEIIVCDDGSRDGSLALVRELMADDARVRLVFNEVNGGPAACRNLGLELAKGRWIAIVDSDDIIHPERFERLLAAADHTDADIVADDLLLFFEDGTAPQLMLGDNIDAAFAVTTEDWVRAGLDGTPALGYLKPLIKAERLAGIRYDEALRIGEDYDLVLRLLLAGAAMLVLPEPFYLYRRHSGSVSYRLSVADLDAMIERQRALMLSLGPIDNILASAFEARLNSLKSGRDYGEVVKNLKGHQVFSVLKLLAADPGHFKRLWASFAEGRGRRQHEPKGELSPLLLLGDREAPGVVNAVPAYVPTANVDWTSPRPRKVWRDLAARRGIGAVRCMPLDRAGWYAAGFIPEAEVAAPEPVRETT